MKLKDLLDSNIDQYGEYPFLFYKKKEYTNVMTKEFAVRFANGLHQLGIEQGDRIVVCMPNCPEVIFAYQGITRTGAIIVPVMFTLHAKEIHYIALNSGAKAVITSSAIRAKVEEALENLPVKPLVILVDEAADASALNFYDIMSSGTKELDVGVEPVSAAVILYTSGTTGNPKGVVLTHKNLFSNAVSSAEHNDAERGTTLGILPLAHVYGLTVSNVCFLTGSSIVVFSKFDPKEVLESIEVFKVRSFSAVPAMIHSLVSYPNPEQYDTASLEWVGSGSAPLPIALLHAFEQKFLAKVYEGYGLSEAAPVVTSHRKGSPIKPGSVGVAIPGVNLKIVDEIGMDVPAGEIGELIVKGDNVTPGYFQNAEETARVIKDGWLYTGDMARMDNEGYIYIADRKKDLIIRGGFNIYPRDIEELLIAHQAVSEAAIVGIPDERMGEEMVACVVKKPGVEVTEEELIRYCQDHLAKNKTPRRILFFDSLPRNGVGKILKTALRITASESVENQKMEGRN